MNASLVYRFLWGVIAVQVFQVNCGVRAPEKQKEMCGICYDHAPQNTTRLSCLHAQNRFCWACVYKWLEQQRLRSCPLCRAPQVTRDSLSSQEALAEDLCIFIWDHHVESVRDVLMKLRKQVKTQLDLKNIVYEHGLRPIHSAAAAGNVDILTMVHAHDPAFLQSKDALGRLPIHYAAARGKLEIVRLIRQLHEMEGGVKELLCAVDCDGRTPMHLAAANGRLELVRFLHSLDPKFVQVYDENGDGPMHLAAWNGHADVIKYLGEVDRALLSTRDKYGRMPIHVAIQNDQVESVKQLCILDADASHRINSRGEVPYQYAVRHKSKKVLSLFVNKQSHLSTHKSSKSIR